MTPWSFAWNGYRRFANMAEVPNEHLLQNELKRRKDAETGDEQAIGAMLEELEIVQDSIDNRADAILKVGAFLGTGLTVLGKLDDQVPIALSVTVVALSGGSLCVALLAQNPTVNRALVLVPPTLTDLEQSCRQLARNQYCLGAASIFIFSAIFASLIAVICSLL